MTLILIGSAGEICHHASVTCLCAILLACGALFFVGAPAAQAGAAIPPNRVLRTDGDFELRAYPALMVVETPMAADGSDDGFMRLFNYLRGHNEAKLKIAMTAPVLISGSATNRSMAFIMPAALATNQIPQPTDGSLHVRSWPGGCLAVLRYSGGRNSTLEKESLAKLQAWMAAQKLTILSGPVYGYFDPPWVPNFWRHNEVMLRTAPVPPPH